MDNPHGIAWVRHLTSPKSANVDATVGEEGQVYVLNRDNFQSFYVDHFEENNSNYVEIDGQWRHIDAGKGSLIGVSLFNEVF